MANISRTPGVWLGRLRFRRVSPAIVVALALCPIAAAASADEEGQPASEARPNVLVLLADDLQPDAIGALGAPHANTPHLDRLVGRGTVFERTVNMGGWHGAICVSSRAMIITGRNLFTCGGGTCGDHRLWGETFRDAGYATFGTGKWHNGAETFERSFEFRGPTGPGMYHSTPQDGDGYDRPRADRPDTWDPADETRAGHWLELDDGVVHSSTRWVDETIGFLDAHDARHEVGEEARPFFAYVAFHAPHDPRQAPQRFLDANPVDSCELPPNYLATHPFDQGDARVRDEKLAPFPRDEHAIRLHQREYRAIVDHLDAEIGRLLEELDDRGLTESTIVVFAGDHGLAVGRHGLLGKQNLYEHSVRTPMVFAGPGVAEGRRVTRPVYLHALLATAADLAGVEAHDSVEPEASSLRARLAPDTDSGPTGDHPPAFVGAAYRGDLQRMIRDDRWKLIVYPKARVVQLFDLASDPWELTNLAANPANEARIRRLHTALLEWMDCVEDPLDRTRVAEPWTWDAPVFEFGAELEAELDAEFGAPSDAPPDATGSGTTSP